MSSFGFHWVSIFKGHWPVKKQLCEGNVHGAGASGVVVRDALRGPSRQVGGGAPVIPVEAQAVASGPCPRRSGRHCGHAPARPATADRPILAERLPARRGAPPGRPARRRVAADAIAPAASPGPLAAIAPADQPAQPGGQEQAARRRTAASSARPPRSPASRAATTPPAARRAPAATRLSGRDHHPGDHHQGRVAHRDAPREIPARSDSTPPDSTQSFLKTMIATSR